MASGTLGLSIRELESKITYPVYKKKIPLSEPLRSQESRRLLEQYRASVTAERLERMRYQIINSPASTGLSGSRPLTSSRLNATPTPSTLLHAADAAEEEGRIEDAIGCLLEALKMCTASGISHRRQSSEINERLGVMHLGKDMIEESIGFFTEGIRVDPTYSKNYLHRAECFVLTDDPHSAFTEYEKYFKLEHATKAQLVRCGKCALDADLLDEAEAYLMATLAHPDRDSPDSNTNSAYACYNLGA